MESIRSQEPEPTMMRSGLPRSAITQKVFNEVPAIYYRFAYPDYDMSHHHEQVETMLEAVDLRLGAQGNAHAKLQLINNKGCTLLGFDYYGNTGTHDESADVNARATEIREAFQNAVDGYLTSTGLAQPFEPY